MMGVHRTPSREGNYIIIAIGRPLSMTVMNVAKLWFRIAQQFIPSQQYISNKIFAPISPPYEDKEEKSRAGGWLILPMPIYAA